MRHGKKFNHLSRKAPHRKAMFANLASSLIEHKRINTTKAKAKALRKFVEPLVTKSKTDTTHNRRLAFKKLRNKHAVSELFREVAPKVGDRPGGYTRVIKLGKRLGDGAEMAMIELVDYNELYDLSSGGRKRTRRSRRGGKKNTKKAETSSGSEDSAEAGNETQEGTAPQKETEESGSNEETASESTGSQNNEKTDRTDSNREGDTNDTSEDKD